jgi:uncharacterized protein YndB with AHSA1/START domain
MPDIFQDFPIKAPPPRVFSGFATPQGLDEWWTQRAAGVPILNSEYQFWFGPQYDWRGVVTRCVPDQELEWKMTRAHADWKGTLVGVRLECRSDFTWVRFYHTGWPEINEHFRISNHCWGMYLRILRRFLESGERVPYEERLQA